MKQYICIVIRTNRSKMFKKEYDNNQEHKDICYINPFGYPGACCRRYDIIYCDKHFLDDSIGRIFIKTILEPLMIPKSCEEIIFI